ncbi:hypothetical protein BJ741DRAFT_377169 [Chytriomyces cf. hyalinus JEL632]|nr:hypothetical protein BJ741DRAFT_377169 [Chytriomyces cf. hyalinus JEL632]
MPQVSVQPHAKKPIEKRCATFSAASPMSGLIWAKCLATNLRERAVTLYTGSLPLKTRGTLLPGYLLPLLQQHPMQTAAPIPFATTTPFLNLTVCAVSPLITLRISQPVPGFKIEVSGVDVKCEPRVLDFTKGACASFRVTGLSTG